MEDVDFMVNIVTFIFYYDKSYTTLLSRCPSILLCRPRRRALWLGCLRSRSRTWAYSSLEHSQPGDELKGRHMMLAKDAVITAEAAVGASAMQSVETELRRTAHRRDLFRSIPEMRVRLLPCRPHGHAHAGDGRSLGDADQQSHARGHGRSAQDACAASVAYGSLSPSGPHPARPQSRLLGK